MIMWRGSIHISNYTKCTIQKRKQKECTKKKRHNPTYFECPMSDDFFVWYSENKIKWKEICSILFNTKCLNIVFFFFSSYGCAPGQSEGHDSDLVISRSFVQYAAIVIVVFVLCRTVSQYFIQTWPSDISSVFSMLLPFLFISLLFFFYVYLFCFVFIYYFFFSFCLLLNFIGYIHSFYSYLFTAIDLNVKKEVALLHGQL